MSGRKKYQEENENYNHFSECLQNGQLFQAENLLLDLVGEKLNKKGYLGGDIITDDFRNAKLYLMVVFEQLQRLRNSYVDNHDNNARTKNKITKLNNFFKDLYIKVQNNWVKSIGDIREALENSDVISCRRARTIFFEPIYTNFEKNLRFKYLDKLIQIAIRDKIAQVQRPCFDDIEASVKSKDNGFTFFGRKDLARTMMNVERLTRLLEKREITTIEKLEAQIEKFTPPEKKRLDVIEDIKSSGILACLSKCPF